MTPEEHDERIRAAFAVPPFYLYDGPTTNEWRRLWLLGVLSDREYERATRPVDGAVQEDQ